MSRTWRNIRTYYFEDTFSVNHFEFRFWGTNEIASLGFDWVINFIEHIWQLYVMHGKTWNYMLMQVEAYSVSKKTTKRDDCGTGTKSGSAPSYAVLRQILGQLLHWISDEDASCASMHTHTQAECRRVLSLGALPRELAWWSEMDINGRAGQSRKIDINSLQLFHFLLWVWTCFTFSFSVANSWICGLFLNFIFNTPDGRDRDFWHVCGGTITWLTKTKR